MTFEDGIKVPLRHDYTNKIIAMKSNPDPSSMAPSNGAYFSAPAIFLGDQRASYNQELGFKLKIIDQGPVATQEDIVITGMVNGRSTRISLSITSQNNSLPSIQMQDYTFRLHENDEFSWTPSGMTSMEFMSALSNITSFRIRGSFVTDGTGFLDNFKLQTAVRGGGSEPANWIER